LELAKGNFTAVAPPGKMHYPRPMRKFFRPSVGRACYAM